MAFLNQLDEMLGLDQKKDEVAPEERLPGMKIEDLPPENPFDESIEVPEVKDPFALAIQAALQEEGVDVSREMQRKYDPAGGDITQHEWITHRERLYDNEPYIFKCKRCLKYVTVYAEETIGQALQEGEIDPNCGAQVVSDTMNA